MNQSAAQFIISWFWLLPSGPIMDDVFFFPNMGVKDICRNQATCEWNSKEGIPNDRYISRFISISIYFLHFL